MTEQETTQATETLAPKPPPPKPRVNIISQVYWQGPDASPILSECRQGYMLECEDEPYQRNNLRINLQWQKIDTGWLSDKPISQVVILNTSKDTHLEIGIKVPNHEWIIDYASIPPGQDHRFVPTQIENIYLRSRDKSSKFTIRVFPA